jgi:hypothetical protein
MSFTKKSFLAVLLVAAVVFVAAAAADHGNGKRGGDHGKLFSTTLIGNRAGEAGGPSDPADEPIHGLTTAGRSWNLKRGTASLSQHGKFRLRVRGLVLASGSAIGTTAGIPAVQAALFCGNNSETTPVFMSDPVPFSSEGNARVKGKATVPSRCAKPVVVVLIAGTTRFIALSGFTT